MADIRIKDLSSASSSASDDFIAVDGTTNGTRKLNAFSPTFGGNATVTGTLTTVGATGSFGSSSSAGTSLKVISGVGTLASPKYSTLDFRTYNDSASGAYIRTGNRQSDTAAFELEIATRSNSDVLTQIATFSDSKLSVLATTASTTTSTGALVVGNGTSGGLGVGGAINAGGNISIASGNSLRLYNSGNTAYISVYNFNERLNVNYPTSLIDSTASTSTSSGALVVSGGVGVAGKVNAGSFTTTGITLSAVQSVSVSTTAVDIATGTEVGGLYFVTGYNNADGAQGSWLVMTRGTSVTTISSNNNTGLTVTFSVRISGFSAILQAATASGTLITNATAFTR